MEMTSQASPSSVSATTPIDDGEDGPNGLDPNRWFFEKERLEFTPSRKCGIDADKELAYRQQSANFIQDMGQRLQVNQLCINTAIVYMHRFYMYHSFSHFHRNHVSTASIFLAAKVEEQPRKLEHVIKVAHYCLNRESQPIDVKSENYAEQTSELVMTENILLQTLGFDVAIDHPHTHVVKCCQLVRASKDLAQTSYFMATNSLHLTTMCLQYKPTVVACVCIHMTCKWSNWEIPRSKEGRDWFWYVDDSVTMDQLEKLTTEFLTIFDKSPSRLKKKIISLNQASGGTSSLTLSSFPTFNLDPTSPGAPQFPPARSHSPATTATSHYGSSSSLGKRSSSSLKPSGSQINNKQGKVNGGIGHHPVKPPHGSQNPPSSSSSSSKHPHFSTSSSSSSSSSSKGILPPGSHHGAKDAHLQQQTHAKQSGHHHSSSGHGPQAYPHGTSNRPSSSHSHPSGHLSQSHAPPSGQPRKPISAYPTSSSSTSSHSMSGQHPPKSQLPQPSKVPYNYNIKSQPPPPQQIPSSGLPPSKSSSSSLSQSSSNPPSSKIHTQPPPYNQIKKPYPDASRRENSSAGDFNGKRESSDDMNRRNNANSQSRSRPSDKTGDLFTTGAGSMSNLPPVSLPFNASTTAEPTTRSWVDTSSSITSNNTNNVSIIEPPRIPPGRTSLFSPDPEIPETSSISSSIQSIVKRELSPLGGGDVVGLGGAKGDHSTDAFAAHTSSMGFPTLFEFGRSSSSSNDPTSFITDLKPDLGLGGSSSSVGVSGIFGSGGNHNNSDMIITDASVLTSSLSSAPVSTSTLSSVTMPMNSMTCSNISLTSPINPGGGLPPPDMLDTSGGEPPHKKSKKNKKEKHKHKEKDKDKHHDDKKEKKDKDEKKRNKDKNKDKSKDDKKHKEKGDKEKHKKDKHKDKDRDKSSKGSSKHSGPSEASSPGYPDMAGNKIKFTIGSRPIDVPTQEKSKSKHSSKKHSSKSSTAPSSETSSSSSAPASTPSIKLKIVPVRPPSSKDDSKLVFTSKQN